MEHCVLCFAWSKCLWLSYKIEVCDIALHMHTQTHGHTQASFCPIALHQIKSLLSQLLADVLGGIRFEKVLHLKLSCVSLLR